jgi:ribonuclease P/MRP protein subunit POP5
MEAVKYYSPMTHVCIIRVGREHVRTAWGAVTMLSSVDGHRVIPNVVHVSGALLAVIEYYHHSLVIIMS